VTGWGDLASVRPLGAEKVVSDATSAEACIVLGGQADSTLRTVIDSIDEGLTILDAAFRIVGVNHAALRMDGRPRADLIGRDHWQAYPGTEDSELGRLYKKAMRERVPVSLVHHYVWPDGRPAWFDMRAYPTDNGGIAIVFRDVTERHTEQERLRESETRFRLLAESIDEVFYVLDLDRRTIEYVSPAYERLWQRPTAELYADATSYWKAIHPDDVAIAQAIFASQIHGQSSDIRYRLVQRDGAVRHIRDRAFVVDDPATGRPRVVGIAEDVTQATEAQALLARNAATFESLVTNNPFGIYVVGQDLRLRSFSRGSARVFAGIDPLIGRDIAEILRIVWAEPFASDAIARFRHTLATGEPYTNARTVEPRANIDAVEAYDWRIERIVLPDGSHGVVCYFYDLSEREQLDAQLRQALSDKEMLMREIDHRVSNSLAMISSLLSLQRASARHAETRDALTGAAARVIAIGRLHDRLHRSRVSGLVDFAEYLAELCRDIDTTIGSEEVAFELDCAPVALPVETAMSLGIVANELITNACKHSRVQGDAGARVTVGLSEEGGAPRFWVANSGAGMAADFDPGRGKGLGLRVIDSLVRKIGGRIAYPTPGGEARFTVTLPPLGGSS